MRDLHSTLTSRVVLRFMFCAGASLVHAGPGNIAPLAQVTASSEFSDTYTAAHVVDSVIRIADQGEWACQGATSFWGYIKYPWIQLTWDQEQTITRVVVYDRPTTQEHTAGGLLEFSDGSEVRVLAIPNDSSLSGVEVYTQAAHFGGVVPFALGNALDLVLGF